MEKHDLTHVRVEQVYDIRRHGIFMPATTSFIARLCFFCVFLLFSPVILFPQELANASQLGYDEFSIMVESTVADNDALLLLLLSGNQPGQGGNPAQTLIFNSSTNPTSWLGTLSGAYIGQSVNLAYTNGTLTGSPVTTSSWNTTGTYGGRSITGGGTATISYLTASTFNLMFSDALGFNGGDSYMITGVIPGTILSDGTAMFGSPGNEEVGNFTFYHNLAVVFLSFQIVESESRSIIGGHVLSDIDFIWSDGTVHRWITNIDNAPVTPYPTGYDMSQSVIYSTVPEPCTLSLIGIGAVGVAFMRRNRSIV